MKRRSAGYRKDASRRRHASGPRWPWFLLGSLITGGVTWASVPATPSTGAWQTGSCRVIDGDTLGCGGQRIRLLGIDAPELPGHCRKGRHCAPGDPYAATRALEGAAQGLLRIQPVTQDRYGRSIATVSNAGGEDLSCIMLKAGAAYRSDWDNGGHVFRHCPLTAMLAGSGLVSSPTTQPPPAKDQSHGRL